jgi:type II secretory pathway pseudopilin PulG
MCTSDRSRRAAAGFTIVELLVGLVLASLFATILFQLVRGQSRFVAIQSAREEVQQNVRGALDIIASELRAVPAGGLMQGDASTIRFLVPRAIGVHCGGGGPAAMTVLFPGGLPAGTIPAGTSPNTRGLLGAGALVPPFAWSGNVPVSQVNQVTAVAANAVPCSNLQWSQAAAGGVQAFTFTGNNLPGAVTPLGGQVIFFDVVQYEVDTDADGRFWIQRGTGVAGSQQPLAGPLPAANSLQFQYFDVPTGGVAFVPGNTRANLDAVARVQIDLTARSRNTLDGNEQTEAGSITVFLRN